MSARPLDLSALSAAQRQTLRQLTRAPRYSWPVIALWLLVMTLYLGSYVAGFAGWMPLWVGMLINSLVGYYAFTVVHDAIHRAVSTRTALNDFIGQTTVVLGAPYIDLRLFRWGHILHHRYTNGLRDPDRVLHGPAWSLPLRWLFIDLLYLRHALRHGDAVSARYLRSSLVMAAVTALLFGALIAAGYGEHLLMLWLIPSRVLFLTLGFSFFWLPHVPHDTRQEDHLTRATTVRLGHEWLLSPLLQGQNYHLIHHLYPSTPCLHNRRVWQLLEPVLRQRDLAIQHGFALRPTIYPAPTAVAPQPPAATAV
ncbi:MAG TPA: fatty acid desaturase [Nevskiaceae bacterium]|nr:fatty acid desaturase [Nevskiaceae bacterium]